MAAKPQTKPPAIFLMGPTAAGKTGLAIKLREQFPLDIISVDSALVYRGMDIGTAKPDAATLRTAPHALIDLREPTESYSVAEFRADALAQMSRMTQQGRVPLLSGGTGLYFKALSGGLANMPGADPVVRARIEKRAQDRGWAAMHGELASLDPETALRIHPNDPQRIQRALEVIELSGRKMSDLHKEQKAQDPGYRCLKIVVCPQDRKTLHARIEKRFHQMLKAGFLEEMKNLRRRGDLTASMPSMRCVGYRQAWAYLEGETSREEMIDKAVAATRQLAKRQLTWLRQESDALWYDLASKSAQESVIKKLRSFLEN